MESRRQMDRHAEGMREMAEARTVHLGNIGIDGKIILEWILKKQCENIN
jgi:hypothetical protein